MCFALKTVVKLNFFSICNMQFALCKMQCAICKWYYRLSIDCSFCLFFNSLVYLFIYLFYFFIYLFIYFFIYIYLFIPVSTSQHVNVDNIIAQCWSWTESRFLSTSSSHEQKPSQQQQLTLLLQMSQLMVIKKHFLSQLNV